jgi:hypothetical protein
MAAPLVCMYLFLDERGGTLPPHPSARTSSPLRYLECALVQSASLVLRGAACELAIVTNAAAASGGLGRSGRRLWDALDALGVARLHVAAEFAPGSAPDACRFPRTALRALEGEPEDRVLWLPNLDCVWVDPGRALGAAPPPGRVGCLVIGYPAAWRVGGPPEIGDSRERLGATARMLGGSGEPPPWVGADLLAGRAGDLRGLFSSCDELESRLRDRGLAGNEQLLTLSCALGRARAEDLSPVARRIQTGARHAAEAPREPGRLGVWHLPAEKGLSLRRTAAALLRGGEARVLADLQDPSRAAARFNLPPPSRLRALRDGAWVLGGRLRGA